MKIKSLFFICFLFAILLVGCGQNEPEAVEETAVPEVAQETAVPETPVRPEAVMGVATVESIEVIILESFPVEIDIKARGSLPNGCTSIEDVSIDRTGTEFNIGISTTQDPEAVCTQQLVAFEETIPLDVADLAAGSYQVNVNGRTGSFTLSVDNVEGALSTPTPIPEPTPTSEPVLELALVNGRVWHDLCSVAPGDGENEGTPSQGCIAQTNTPGFQANGLLEEGEPGLQSILVNLGEGECPSTGFASIATDEDGDYVFLDIPAGTYCLSIDNSDPQNASIQEEGLWTFPENNVSEVTITLEQGEIRTGVNFGWDYAFLPAPEVDLTNCENNMEFVEDVNIPDDTVFAPGETFEKRWLLRNTGTCPWTEDYALTFLDGALIPDVTSIPLESVVVAGQTVELSAQFTAPAEEGTYRSNWQIADGNGILFGVNGLIEEAFWVQIVVGIPSATPEPNSGVIGGVVWEDICFIDEDGNPSVGCVEIEDSGFYRADGSLNFNEGRLSDISVTLSQGACPEDGTINAAAIISTTVTDEFGLYRFSNLSADTYCVSISAFSDENIDLLLPGDWTWPFPGVGRQGVLLDDGEELLEVDFGWDFSN